jgi:hypothetical protein
MWSPDGKVASKEPATNVALAVVSVTVPLDAFSKTEALVTIPPEFPAPASNE